MPIPFTDLVQALPSTTPFVGPETLERQRKAPFKARIGANESAFGISTLAAEALHDAIGVAGCSWYGDPENHELRLLLSEQLATSSETICVDAGIDTLLGLAVRMLVSVGTPVVSSLGAYPTFNYHVSGFGGVLHTVAYRNQHEDVDGLLEAAHKHSARLLYLSNPDNPMGTSLSADVVQSCIDQLPENCILLLDEAYTEFMTSQSVPPIDTDNPQLIRFRTFSKAYGLAGMRIGYAIAHPDLITGFNKIRNHFGVNKLAQIAAAASLRDNQMLPRVQQQVQAGRQRIYDLADALKLACLPSSTNFVAVDLGSAETASNLLQQLDTAGIFMRKPQHPPLDRYLRVGIGSAEEHSVFAAEFSRIISQN